MTEHRSPCGQSDCPRCYPETAAFWIPYYREFGRHDIADRIELALRLRGTMTKHPHEHTTHQLRDVIEALPRYDIGKQEHGAWDIVQSDTGRFLKLVNVRAVVHKAATLGAPIAERCIRRVRARKMVCDTHGDVSNCPEPYQHGEGTL